jgi:transcriptional regulator with XRE-family HTH domain
VSGVKGQARGKFGAFLSKEQVAMQDTPPETTLRISRRLRELREVMGHSQSTMARLAGISVQAWHNYEKGIRRISLDEALKLCDATSVTLDWIYRGQGIGLLPHALVLKLRQAR